MEEREDHIRARRTATNHRPHTTTTPQFMQLFQYDIRRNGIVHNHPSGDPTPSQADIQMTKAIVDIATPLGISVHDHIIVGKNGHTSLKGMRLI